MSAISVWREYAGDVQLVGSISLVDSEIRFTYQKDYRGSPISISLPLSSNPASARTTTCFFSALIPEGSAREEFARMLHAERGEFTPYLERLNDESIGALLFSPEGKVPYQSPQYSPIETGLLDNLAARPIETAVATMGKTRLSLSGAMAKIGLYQDEKSEGWFYPLGGAPSTHIIKASDEKRFPLETINEALCLGIARRCDFPTPECKLLKVNRHEPLLAIRRFDRIFPDKPRIVSGLPAPQRLHQEDFSQATSISLKYEPTDGNYLPLVASTTSHNCSNSFGETNLIVEYTLLHYLLGNCDNHLKNYALLYDSSWKEKELAPIYDVVSTVAYPSIYKEMGISFGGDRHIEHVNRQLLETAITQCGLPLALVKKNLTEMAKAIPDAAYAEAESLAGQGFSEAIQLAESLVAGAQKRFKACS